ncbi:MAG: DUF711 family protein [Planctomycetota bacterium]|jgi:uncharacterized protein (UPF0210 family)
MRISVEEVFETVKMTVDHNFDIRTVTLGINLKDCIDRTVNRLTSRIYKRIVEKGKQLNLFADMLQQRYSIPITNRRIAVTPVSLLIEALPRKIPIAVKIAQALDKARKDANIDFIGGFGAMVQKGMTQADELLINSIPQALSKTQRVCGFLNLASTQAGLNMNAVEKFGHTLRDLAKRTKNGIGCTKIAVFANVPEDNPFMAGAHHGIGEPDSRAGELIGREIAQLMKINFGIVDISLASTTSAHDSVAEIIEAMGVKRIGLPGSTAALAMLMDAVKKGGAMASGNIGGLSGTFIPVSEDAGMIRAVKTGSLTLDKLEALTSVCSVGLDMFAVPGETPAEVLSSIIADELSIGMINNKTTGVRVIPVPGKKYGDIVHFGGLLGSAPIMKVPKIAAPKLIARKGRIPSPIQSLRN